MTTHQALSEIYNYTLEQLIKEANKWQLKPLNKSDILKILKLEFVEHNSRQAIQLTVQHSSEVDNYFYFNFDKTDSQSIGDTSLEYLKEEISEFLIERIRDIELLTNYDIHLPETVSISTDITDIGLSVLISDINLTVEFETDKFDEFVYGNGQIVELAYNDHLKECKENLTAIGFIRDHVFPRLQASDESPSILVESTSRCAYNDKNYLIIAYYKDSDYPNKSEIIRIVINTDTNTQATGEEADLILAKEGLFSRL